MNSEEMDYRFEHLSERIEAENEFGRREADKNKKVYSVQEIQDILGISLASAYQLVARRLFKSMKIGRTVRISKSSFDAWLDGETCDDTEAAG